MKWKVEKLSIFDTVRVFAFNQGVNAVKIAHEICVAYGEGTMRQSTDFRWFAFIKTGILTSRTNHTPANQWRLMDRLLHAINVKRQENHQSR